ncbi:MAG: hypothetical protein ABIF77_22230 [bacterium]
MNTGSATPTEQSLDTLSRRALAGDSQAETAFFHQLRVRFLTIAKRRVRPDSLEDVVQDALRIVHEKHTERGDERGILMWSLTVLRNVIGNYYQAKERQQRHEAQVENLEALPAASSLGPSLAWTGADPDDFSETGALVRKAVAVLAEKSPRCGFYFQRILESLDLGGGPREISQRALEWVQRDEPDLTRGSFYTALHRCRARLREILAAMEASPSHE